MLKMEDTERLYHQYFAMVYSICLLYMKNEADACDMVQETFLRLMQSRFAYHDEEKTKAWLIVTASNCCKSSLGKAWRKKQVTYDPEIHEMGKEDPDNLLLQMVLRYAMPGGFKEKKIAVKSNLDQIVYRMEKRDAAQEEYQPLYLSVSKLSFRLLIQRDVFRKLEDDEDPPMVVFTTKDGLERYGSSFVDVPKDNSPMMKLADDPGNERKYGIISDVFYEDNHDKWHASPKAMIDHPDQIESVEINGVQYDLVSK